MWANTPRQKKMSSLRNFVQKRRERVSITTGNFLAGFKSPSKQTFSNAFDNNFCHRGNKLPDKGELNAFVTKGVVVKGAPLGFEVSEAQYPMEVLIRVRHCK